MKSPLIIPFALAAIVIATSSCCSNTESDIKTAGAYLQDAQNSVDNWGKISVSDLLLVENTGQFKINFDEDATNYVNAARTTLAGTAFNSQASSEYFGFSGSVQATVPISAGSAPAAGSTNAAIPGLPPNPAAAALNSNSSLSQFLQLYASLNPAIDERTATQKGINDKMAELILKFMANPDVGSNQQKVVFGIMQVTCEPGKATRRHYSASLNVSIKYARVNSNTVVGADAAANNDSKVTRSQNNSSGASQFKASGSQPSVIAVLPLVDSQNVALGVSSFEQFEIALQLSAAFSAKGITGAASALNDYINQHQSQVNTRNSIPVITSYTDGSTFGFEIYPSLQAQANPGNSDSGPGDVLQPITFPAVVAILIDKADLGAPAKSSIVVSGLGTFNTTTKTSQDDLATGKSKALNISGTFSLDDIIAVAPQDSLSITNGFGMFTLTNAGPSAGPAGKWVGNFALTNTPSSQLPTNGVLDPKCLKRELGDYPDLKKFLVAKGLPDPDSWPNDYQSLQIALVPPFNQIITTSDPQEVTKAAQAATAKFRPETKALIGLKPSDSELKARIVRLILEDAYPHVFSVVGKRIVATGTLKAKQNDGNDAQTKVPWKAVMALTVTKVTGVPNSVYKNPPKITAGLGPEPVAQKAVDTRTNVDGAGEGAEATIPTGVNFSERLQKAGFTNSLEGMANIQSTTDNPKDHSDPEIAAQAVLATPDGQVTPATTGGTGNTPWNCIQTELRTDWLPIKSNKTFTMESRLEVAADLDRANTILDKIRSNHDGSLPQKYWYQADQIQVALDSLSTVALGFERLSSLPSDLFTTAPITAGPKIIDAYPHIVWRDKETKFTVSVTNLTSPELISIAGIAVTNGERLDSMVSGIIPSNTFATVTSLTNTVEFVVSGNEGVVSKAIPLALLGKIDDQTHIRVKRENGKWTGLTVDGGVTLSSSNALNGVESVLEKSEPPPKTTYIVP